MRADRKKIELAMARACLSNSEVAERADMPETTAKAVLQGRSAKPCTIGKVAKALGVDVTEIIEEEQR